MGKEAEKKSTKVHKKTQPVRYILLTKFPLDSTPRPASLAIREAEPHSTSSTPF